jgi:hypothetical protein
MNVITRTAAPILLLLLTLTAPVVAQQKRPTPKPQPRATPAPTFETLVPADSYKIYGEVRGVGQVIRSSALTDLIEPVLKVAGPPKEFKTVVKWLNAHSEDVMTSRLLLATWPTGSAKDAPQTLIAIEFATAEEATKFAGTLNEFLSTIVPPQPTPEPSPKSAEGENTTDKPKPAAPPEPGFHLQRMGSLLVITPRPWTMKQLKPAGSKLLAEDANFRAAYNRFSTEPLFLYFDSKAIEKEDVERERQLEEQQRLAVEQAKREQEEAKTEPKEPDEPGESGFLPEKTVEPQVSARIETVPSEGTKETGPDQVSMALMEIGSSFFEGKTHWPEGIAVALSFEGDSFDLRALLVNQGGEKADVLPFAPMLITGPALSPESANIFPADTELLLMMSLDLPQIYAVMSKPPPKQIYTRSLGATRMEAKEIQPESPFAAIEQRLKINLKDDLLPLLGSEIAVRLPAKDSNIIGMPGLAVGPSTITAEQKPTTAEQKPNNAAPVIAIAVKDKEGLRALMPKLLDNFGFKGASSLMQTERREDTELVSFGNVFAYAFVGNFIVISTEAASTRYVVDSYLKHETLSSDIQFKNSTRWQPRPLHGQVYISPVLMEGFKTWAQSTQITDQVRTFLAKASTVAQPITYSLSNEGFGPLHEVHIPRNLILMAVAGISGEVNPPPLVQNERMAIGMMYMIVRAEDEYKEKNGGTFGTLEELIAADMVPKDNIERSGYKFELTVSGDKFEVSAVPLEYGKTGRLSMFLDHTRVLRGGDKSGVAASASDPPIF